MSRKGIDWLIRSEGVRYQVYDDRGGGIISSYESARGYPTIGVGHLIRSDKDKARFEKYLGGREEMTHEQVVDLLREDLPKYEKPIQDRVTEPLTQEMFDALVHLTFNVGGGSYAVKNAIKAVNEKDYEGAAEAIRSGPKSSKGVELAGLVKRRNKEADYFLSGGLPTGIALFGTRVRILPVVAGVSVALLGFALYVRIAQPEWANFMRKDL